MEEAKAKHPQLMFESKVMR